MFGRQHGRWQSLHAQLSQCRDCRRLLFLDVFIGCLLFLGRAKDPYPLLLGLQEMLMLTPVFGGGSFLRWRHQLCYNSPSTSSFNLTENLFFRDVETPTRRMSSAADGPWKFGSYNALHTPDLVQLIFIYYIIYIYIYIHIYLLGATGSQRQPEREREPERGREQTSPHR